MTRDSLLTQWSWARTLLYKDDLLAPLALYSQNRMRRRSHIEKTWADGVEVGQENAEFVARGEAWCKHLRITSQATGLITQLTGLPVGMLELSCKHAKGKTGTGRLSWTLPEFLWEQCRGCKHHSPNGDTSWGEVLLKDKEEAEAHAGRREAEAAAELSKTRESLRHATDVARKNSDVEQQRVAELAEGIFGDDFQDAKRKSHLLSESASVASDLFSEEILQILIDNCRDSRFSALCLPVVVELAKARRDLAPDLLELARHLVAEDKELEAGAAIALGVADLSREVVPDDVVREVCIRRSYYEFLGSRQPPGLDRSASTELLKRCMTSSRSTILQVLKKKLAHEGMLFRSDACELIWRLMLVDANIGLELVADITRSLLLEDDSEHESADAAACSTLARLYLRFPEEVEEEFRKTLGSSSQLMELRCKAYRMLFHQLSDRRKTRGSGTDHADAVGEDSAFDMAFSQCLAFIGNRQTDLGVRNAAVEAIDYACGFLSEEAAEHVDALLGTLALVYSEDESELRPPSRILLPGEPEPSEDLKRLDLMSLHSDWNRLRSGFGRCLDELARKQPLRVADVLLSTLESMGREGPEDLRARLVSAVAQLASQDVSLLARALPGLMRAAMDFDSALVRLRGVEALETAFRSDAIDPPGNIGQAILLHLRDPVIGVNQAAMRALGSRDWGLTSDELREALGIFAFWLDSYRGDSSQRYNLERLASAFLRLARVNRQIHSWAVERVLRLLPTGDDHKYPDQKLCLVLIRQIDGNEQIGAEVGRAVLNYLARYPREQDWNAQYEYTERHRMFSWLQRLPSATLARLHDELEACARAVAKVDSWEVLAVASLLGRVHSYELEAQVLDLAQEPIENEEFWKPKVDSLRVLSGAAKANVEKVSGRFEDAVDRLARITEDAETL